MSSQRQVESRPQGGWRDSENQPNSHIRLAWESKAIVDPPTFLVKSDYTRIFNGKATFNRLGQASFSSPSVSGPILATHKFQNEQGDYRGEVLTVNNLAREIRVGKRRNFGDDFPLDRKQEFYDILLRYLTSALKVISSQRYNPEAQRPNSPLWLIVVHVPNEALKQAKRNARQAYLAWEARPVASHAMSKSAQAGQSG